MTKNKKIYFASDLHLGLPNHEESLKREKLFVKWLNEIKEDAEEIYLLGDIFDFWFEYKRVIPKGFSRFLGKLCELTDSGIPVHFFTGNHDIWVFDYLPQETGVIIHKKPIVKEFNGKKFFLGHGDGLGPGDRKFKGLKKIFTNSFAQWLFNKVHPNIGIRIAHKWSHSRRDLIHYDIKEFQGNNEWLIQFVNKKIKEEHFDYFIFGHRHLPLDIKINENTRYINLGDWITNNTYAVFDGKNLELKSYQ